MDPEWDFDVRDEPVNEPGTGIWWRHFPEAAEEGFVLAGHTHPAVTLRDTDGSAARLPCFHFAERVATLPAFGAFTGSAVIRPAEGDQVVVTAGEAVVVVQ